MSGSAAGSFADLAVAVTGAGGSIGSEVCRAAVVSGARRLVLVSLTENGLYNVTRQLRREFPNFGDRLVPVLGSVEDSLLMRRCLAGVDVVVHAAAHKHVPICQANPCAAILNNAWGTHVLVAAAAAVGVRQFCFVSSDKAVLPASIMGATKRLGELVVQAWAASGGQMACFSVRFGNVLDSAGSVLPLWREQIAAGGPVTLTDERCERFFMSIPMAVGLVASVVGLRPRGGTFVLDMGAPRRLVNLARDLIAASGRPIELRLTGLRAGEKLTEELHHGGTLVETPVPGVFLVEEDPTLLPDVQTLLRLRELAQLGETAPAVALLWELVQ
jgi:FlaA1/EpsC-like NDP-sugar epimerase